MYVVMCRSVFYVRYVFLGGSDFENGFRINVKSNHLTIVLDYLQLFYISTTAFPRLRCQNKIQFFSSFFINDTTNRTHIRQLNDWLVQFRATVN